MAVPDPVPAPVAKDERPDAVPLELEEVMVGIEGFGGSRQHGKRVVQNRRRPKSAGVGGMHALFAGELDLVTFSRQLPHFEKTQTPQSPSLMFAHLYLGLYYEPALSAAIS